MTLDEILNRTKAEKFGPRLFKEIEKIWKEGNLGIDVDHGTVTPDDAKRVLLHIREIWVSLNGER
jgi:hypothetical protein